MTRQVAVMNNLLIHLGLASAIGTLVFVALVVLRPVTKKHFSSSWHYYMSFAPVFFLVGGVWL